MPTIRQISQFLEQKAPLSFQENYDNAGLLVGNPKQEVSGILVCLDSTEQVIEEAIQKKCNLIVAHHPIIFGGLKKLTGRNYVERTVIKAIKNDIALYAIHTNLDNVHVGVNAKIAQKLALKNPKILVSKANTLQKLTVFVPCEDTEKLLDALSKAGAGNIGNYSNCSFVLQGEGSFMPNQAANPHIGEANKLEKVQENRIEVIFPKPLQSQVLAAMRKAHPYEEVAFYLHDLENQNQEVGAGMIGELSEALTPPQFLEYLKDKLQLKALRHTQILDKKIKKVALCGGSGSFLLKNALQQGADAYVTADFKYHEFFDADQQILVADVGHYESEIFTTELLRDWLVAKFENLPIEITQTNTNPVFYA